jgi:hypothetical protein
MALADNISVFFTDFAVEASYNGASILVLFDAAFKLVNAFTGGIESSSPQAVCKDTDIVGMQHGDQLVIRDVVYYVTGIEPDGTGITVLTLSKDA